MQKNIEDYILEMREFAKRSKLSSTESIMVAAASETPAAAASVGALIISVTHSRGTFPINGAKITIFDRDNNIIMTTITNTSGRSERIILPAASKQLSVTPGNNANELAKYYNIQIDAENFVSALIRNIPIFENITSLQAYDMLYKGAATNQDLQIIELPISNL